VEAEKDEEMALGVAIYKTENIHKK